MDYILIENRKTLHFGPSSWKYRMIQNDLDDNGIVFKIPIVEPNSYLKLSDNFEIFPVKQNLVNYNSLYEELAGPFFSFTEDNIAIASYQVLNRPLHTIKNDLKNIAAQERYKKETGGTKISIQSRDVSIDTTREGRNIFIQKYAVMAEDESANWKFREGWVSLSKEDVLNIITQTQIFVQTQFDWEMGISRQIDNAETIEDLKSIVIVEENNNLPF